MLGPNLKGAVRAWEKRYGIDFFGASQKDKWRQHFEQRVFKLVIHFGGEFASFGLEKGDRPEGIRVEENLGEEYPKAYEKKPARDIWHILQTKSKQNWRPLMDARMRPPGHLLMIPGESGSSLRGLKKKLNKYSPNSEKGGPRMSVVPAKKW